ncbi:DUF6792 domain-containing protein [Uliginosibacterium sediminicola]|uniref:DUF6792 domain-containing protein n=1 Tax=Uliginosibacterium sediminicola TaxID=2024550 RepID=A0ABU9YWZ6_9RHOO
MQKKNVFPDSKTLKAVMIMAIALLPACGGLATLIASQDTYQTDKRRYEYNQFETEIARKFGLMALLAQTAYRHDLDTEGIDGNGCRYLKDPKKFRKDLYFGMPQNDEKKGGWSRWVPSAEALEHTSPCIDDAGLFYETYIYENENGVVEEAVIAFRGTENRGTQTVKDWWTNISSLLGLESSEYSLARKKIPSLIDALDTTFPNIKIYATGHSLGGGLAQQAGYLSRKIKEVFTFNTTPVTNWSQLRLLKIVDNEYPIIYRIYHGGEFLEYLRFITTSFTSARPGRYDIGVQFDGFRRKAFSGHAMNIITCNFAEILKNNQTEGSADHHYSIRYIRNTVLTSRSLCLEPKQ